MEKDLVDIVMEKDYIQLSASEKAELNEYCTSEAEYNQMREVLLEVEVMQFVPPTPKKETKESLDSLFDQSYPKAAPVWYLSVLATVVPKEKPVHRQPLMQIAAVGLLFLLAYPFIGTTTQESSTPQIAEAQRPEARVESVANDKMPVKDKEPEAADVFVAELSSSEPVVSTPAIGTTGMSAPSTGAVATGSGHPDGVFEGAEMAFSQPASSEPDMLDLLTAAF